jgi:hypothetical protein
MEGIPVSGAVASLQDSIICLHGPLPLHNRAGNDDMSQHVASKSRT